MRTSKLLARTLFLFAIALLASIEAPAQSANKSRNSGPLTWIASDVNPKTLFWIQGRFVRVDNPNQQEGDVGIETILCSIRENECLDIESTTPLAGGEQVWIDEFKLLNLQEKSAIVAVSRSLDGCTDETLKIRFDPPSVILINSPVLPMPERCKSMNSSMDTLTGEKGATLRRQTEQYMLVPTRGFVPFQDFDLNFGKAPAGSDRSR